MIMCFDIVFFGFFFLVFIELLKSVNLSNLAKFGKFSAVIFFMPQFFFLFWNSSYVMRPLVIVTQVSEALIF